MAQRSIVVTRKTVEVLDICSFKLAAVAGGLLPAFSAGAHVDVLLPGGITRPYSLCNDPAESNRYQLGVLRDAGSRGGSAAMHNKMQVGGSLQISATSTSRPRNRPQATSSCRVARGRTRPAWSSTFDSHQSARRGHAELR